MPTTILLVDDDMSVLDKVGTALSEKQYKVLPAYNFEEAADTLVKQPVDLMITEINLPGEDGFKLIKHARKMIKYRKLPIFLLTCLAEDEISDKLIDEEIIKILPKPVDLEMLFEAVSSTIKRINLEKAGKLRPEISDVRLKTLALLVVDDEIPITELLKEFLDPLVKKVHTAHSFDQAVDVCENNQIDLLISDIKMSEKSGFDLVEWINEYPATAGIPIILITGVKRDVDSVKKAKSLWIDKFLIKPFELDHLKKTIIDVCTNAKRKEKLKKFNDLYTSLDEDAQKEEQNLLHQIRTQILTLKKQLNIASKELRLLPKETSAKARYEVEQKVENLEAKAKDFQDRMSMTKKEFYERRKQIIAIKRSIHQRFEKVL